jgi:hypothetical protein
VPVLDADGFRALLEGASGGATPEH